MNTQPLSWLKQIQEDIAPAVKVPLWGYPPPFLWEEFSLQLKESLDLPTCTVSLDKNFLASSKELLSSFGQHPILRTLELAPLSGTVHVVISSESVEKLTELALSSEKEPHTFSDKNLQEGFYQYLLLCACQTFSHISPYPDLQIQFLETKPLPHTACFCFDLSVSLKEHTFSIRLICSPSFQNDFSRHFAHYEKDLFSSALAESLEVVLKAEAGSCRLSQSDFNRLHVGDFLVLDTCSYNPLLQKGTLTLSLEKTPLFRVKMKKGKLKILDYCTYYGEENHMDEDADIGPFFPEEESEETSSFEDLDDPLEPIEEKKTTAKEALSSSLEIPFPIVVEIDRIHMPLKKLLSLEPGNILELPVHPEQGVYLTVHGKKVAKGELIKLGDAIGVKIVELGEPSAL